MTEKVKPNKPAYYTIDFTTALPPSDCRERLERSAKQTLASGSPLAPVTQQIIFFESDWDFADFLRNGYDATAEAGALAGADRSNLGMRFVDGRAVFVLTTDGWKVSATATGTRYWVDGDLNRGTSSRPYPGGR